MAEIWVYVDFVNLPTSEYIPNFATFRRIEKT